MDSTEVIRPEPKGTLIAGQEPDSTLPHGLAGAPSKHSLHPAKRMVRNLPGATLIAKMWSRRLYRSIAIVTFVVALLAIGLSMRQLVWLELHNIRREQFTSQLGSEIQSLTIWIETQKHFAELISTDPQVELAIHDLYTVRESLQDAEDYYGESNKQKVDDQISILNEHLPEFDGDRERLKKLHVAIREKNFSDSDGVSHKQGMLKDQAVYFVADMGGLILASSKNETIGESIPFDKHHDQQLMNLTRGKSVFIPPTDPSHDLELPCDVGEEPLVWICVPIQREGDIGPTVILGLGYFSVGNFSQSLQSSRIGSTGEAYVFSRTGTMLTESRFTSEDPKFLPRMVHSSVNLPLCPMTTPERPLQPPDDSQPRTEIIQKAMNAISNPTSLKSGVELHPYDNYRGHRVVGAWQWLEEYGFGVVYEIEAREAYRAFDYIYNSQLALLVLVLGFGGFAFYATTAMVSMRDQGTLRVGPYILLQKIGQGGMGQVYLARHEMLKRPTAVKLLREDKRDPDLIMRFEREVQHSSRLKHPNTVRIFDYGKTSEGVFYYAMEYLDGLTLEEVVQRQGWQSVARVLYILEQAAKSLREAHNEGLIHRDIKPLNIMTCRFGGEYDVVKVLDFGLVKNLSADAAVTQVTATTEISGTPMYVPPERVKNPTIVDARVDIYALGATAYYLLTGKPIFDSASIVDVLVQVVSRDVPSVQETSERIIPNQLQQLISRCLAKNPDERPQSMDEILVVIQDLTSQLPWTQNDAKKWWEENAEVDHTAELIERSISSMADTQ